MPKPLITHPTPAGWIRSAVFPTVLILFLGVTGCSTTKENVLPQDGPAMKQIYEDHFQRTRGLDEAGAREALRERETADTSGRSVSSGAIDLYGYTRHAYDEIDTRFPRLPNPTLVMFVYPHLAGSEDLPIPGYTTTFPLYERVEYALPGEVPVFIEP